ncbi:antA/AntB antirepressor family protein [Virgibacillus litoralis]|uniref:Phage anti-repressor protein n=1 Tax=Virgibacillus litoralis TaxID=578221 RepID=A0ABS4HI22_9BACI|nr:antA/AntB antirepressor family protein [Virgibacillus litoralis]MBP1950249.1 phage anti-repressor protein [Virgibacillus litoralis]
MQLKTIANDLLPVYETLKGEKVVFARELHEALFIFTRFNDWIQRNLISVGFTENVDFYSLLSKTSGRPSQDYVLTLDTAKHITMIQRNEVGMKIRQYFIDLEKNNRMQQPNSQAEMMLMFAEQFVNQEKELKLLKGSVDYANERIDNVTDIISLNPKDWRSDVNTLINSIAFKLGKDKSYQDVRKESYQLLEDRGKCDLSRRLQNLKRNMAFEGASKSRIEKTNKMDVIEHDKRLTEIYLAIIKDMAIKYQISIQGKVI